MQAPAHPTPHVFRSAQATQEIRKRYEDCLHSWPVPNEQRYIPTSQGKTFVVVSGPEHAPPVVLLHGTMSNAVAWMREVETWATEFRVYAIDIIGDAGLSAPARPSFASDAHASWLRDVLDGLAVPSASIVGMSMGGAIALDFALRLPERVDNLILLCPGGIADRNILWWALPLLLLGPWGARKVRQRIVGTFPSPVSDEEKKVAELTDLIFKNMVPRTENLPAFTNKQLSRLTMPALVLVGERDVTMDSCRIKHRFEQHVKQAEVLLYPNARHYLGDQSTVIAQFLRRTHQEGDSNA